MADRPEDTAPIKEAPAPAVAAPASEPTTAAPEAPKVAEVVEDVPDPDEDDLDDLDDMLDEFSAVKLNPPKTPHVSAPGPSEPSAAPPLPTSKPPATDGADEFDEDEFAKQLQAGMAEMLGDMGSSPEMQAQFESIFKELGAAAAADESSNPSAGAPPPASSSSFQDNIRRTMERMQASGDSATAAATADSNAEDDFMAELLKQMQGGGAGAGLGGEGGEEEFSKMLLGMMEQLTNKEILYEPMKELHDKFPEWLERNKDKTSAEDLKRYEEQQRLVSEMVVKFEEPTYLDSNAADREYIVDRMQKMQATGSPPSDLVGDMPSAQEALGAPDPEACTPQ
ncbi:hypothetical protein MCOR27_001242 [Pyricularia oryzae]|uniref:Pex19-domain-containing protein n=3 Tax=Pyricularia grisea TaxID=148305 RepID=A0ABQ8NI24_PYRGI|nr:hypothetical protein MCOR01_007080 [Pyricularia oryzae]KAI6296859.1 hypothetical protein MCOR33_006662 [Pyricularia grisea]KAI6256991.1 hypothetical protein MCOR19_006572 [Pyricularia oryzae]KAI6273429.1 hypothetical protein MCOR26_006903 [Pyricularia oryzae]KAI6287671.1 hypothetical protein MCOR27_001242 [Pyricularia oryzae]